MILHAGMSSVEGRSPRLWAVALVFLLTSTAASYRIVSYLIVSYQCLYQTAVHICNKQQQVYTLCSILCTTVHIATSCLFVQ